MPQNVLIANLGNRNITICDKYLSDCFTNKDNQGLVCNTTKATFDFTNFRTFTKSIKDNFEACKEHLQIAILDSFLPPNNQPVRIDKLVLISTNTLNDHNNGQDTLHEAIIIKKLLAEKRYGTFADDKIEIIECRNIPTDSENLMLFFQNTVISRLGLNYPNDQYYFCDSGGTPQMKTAMKLCVEFMIDPEQYEYYQVSQYEQTIQKIPNEQYRKLLNVYQVKLMLNNGANFKAAQKLLPPKDTIHKNLQFIESIFDVDMNRYKQLCASNPGANAIINLQNCLPAKTTMQINNIGDDDFIRLCLLFNKAWFYHIEKQYNYAVLHYCIFIEQYLSIMIGVYNIVAVKNDGSRINTPTEIDKVCAIPNLSTVLRQFNSVLRNTHEFSKAANSPDNPSRLFTLRNRISHDSHNFIIRDGEINHELNTLFFLEAKKLFVKPNFTQDIFHYFRDEVVNIM
ncbi:MAG: hypothetical protein QM528_07800 [Phycisphaerales bacterium]|nr:hypothetical protein [Phycisphaerales bacterium]